METIKEALINMLTGIFLFLTIVQFCVLRFSGWLFMVVSYPLSAKKGFMAMCKEYWEDSDNAFDNFLDSLL